MAEPTLQQVFGAGASQTDDLLVVSKVDMGEVGLKASANNSAESLWLSLLLLAQRNLSTANLVLNPEQSIGIADGGESIVNLLVSLGSLCSLCRAAKKYLCSVI